jgi:pyruvate formate lyase activating enzyme
MIIKENSCTARWWKTISADQVQCFLCPRECIMRDGQRGFCFIRQNIKGELRTSYGIVSALAIDPIEKKPLYHFYPGTRALSLGTVGCNLGCSFCQNWDISKPDDLSLLSKKVSAQAIVQAAKETGCKSVAFTYNEPIISAEYVIDVAKECRKQGIKTIAVTAGYIHALAREEFFQHMDAANVDLKSFSNHFYQKLCKAQLAPVLDTLIYLKKKTNIWIEITNLIIPEKNDSEDDIRKMCAWIVQHLDKNVPVHFSAFHPDYKMTQGTPTSAPVLKHARKIALEVGLLYPYTGNILDVEGSTTFCYACKKALVERYGYSIAGNHLDKDGQCLFCKTICDGYF